ncbi:MAG TPA: ParB N-terminal domain-containing protein [Xanthobacteraceae bacterium]|nr:ParB N-terminal domain-containing protein [Xanthobacteraceae bacterium]
MDYPLHPITSDYADFTDEELAALRESLRKHGLVVPVVVWQQQIVDGRHRAKLCKELCIVLRVDDITEQCKTEEQMRSHVGALNEHRRANTKPLTITEKQARIQAALKANPEQSDRQLARDTGFSHPFVARERAKLEQAGDVETLPRRTDSKGREQPAHKPVPPKPTLVRMAPSPLDGVHELIDNAVAYCKSRGVVDESKVIALVVAAATKEQLEAIIGNPRFGGAYKTAAGARLGATQHAETPQPAPSAASISPEETMARDLDRMVKTLDAFAGLIPHVSPRQFADHADDDVMANAKEVSAWLTQLADLSSSAPDEPQSRTWRNLAAPGSLLKRK